MVATSLNSHECFLLQSGSSIFSWHGTQGTFEQQQLAAKVAEFLKQNPLIGMILWLSDFYLLFAILVVPGSTIKHTKQGTESSSFWFALGGKLSYTSTKVSSEVVRDPHLFAFSFNKELPSQRTVAHLKPQHYPIRDIKFNRLSTLGILGCLSEDTFQLFIAKIV
ncbi:Villin-3 [Orobanche minor]